MSWTIPVAQPVYYTSSETVATPPVPSLQTAPQTVAHQTDVHQPVRFAPCLVIDATSGASTAFHCRICGASYVPPEAHRYTAPFFRCPKCADPRSSVFIQQVVHSCSVM